MKLHYLLMSDQFLLLCLAIDHCADQPCQNGVCENEKDGYKCICDHGWTGGHCEHRMYP